MNVFFAGCLALLAAVSYCRQGHVATHTEQAEAQQVAKDFSYPESPETIKVETPYEAESLAGRISDPTGVGLERALVECLSSGWKKRIDATFTGSEGSFSFSRCSGKTQFLRISKSGFNTLLVKVKIKENQKSPLNIKLGVSQ
jgi:hypothetical protein